MTVRTVPCLVGPTASGKTAAALALAEHLPIEIISLDSALVYRDMNIGTAKPSREERNHVPHHLIDIIDPKESYSAAQFAEDARALIDGIFSRQRQPIIVGGTMLYYKALSEGLHDLPTADLAIRADLEKQALEKGWPALHIELAKVDPKTADRLAPNDAQRISRALEVYLSSGQTLSAWLEHPRNTADQTLTYPVIALEPSDRAVLHQRIADRFEMMLQQGFIDEVESLRNRGDLHPDLPSIRCVGYRQAWAYLDGEYGQGNTALNMLYEKGVIATRQLAKRQLTWLRSMPERKVVDCISEKATSKVVEHLISLCQPHFS